MISGVGVMMATLSLRDMYFQWEAAGVFDFFLPALLIFAVVFGILTSTKVLGGNRGIHFIIAAAIAILAIRVPFVSEFFTTIFPSFGIGLAIVVIVIILMGLFVSKGNIDLFGNALMWGGLGVGVIIAIITFNQYDWFGSAWWQDNWVSVLWILIVVLIIAPFLISKDNDDDKKLKAERRKGFQEGFIPVRREE
jgi:hypothetical protein